MLTYSNVSGNVQRVREKMRYLLWGTSGSMKIYLSLRSSSHREKRALSGRNEKGSLTGKERIF